MPPSSKPLDDLKDDHDDLAFLEDQAAVGMASPDCAVWRMMIVDDDVHATATFALRSLKMQNRPLVREDDVKDLILLRQLQRAQRSAISDQQSAISNQNQSSCTASTGQSRIYALSMRFSKLCASSTARATS